ncbi:conserved hypothetical protein [Talaromyces stipitatus ATCC 10500]|uniref:DUF8035 domain-containing protein n=1 Tax=Talaromyces stipitatus (strain ATCC 10500 / CBS 375.48 / QM 6759 / NRRL 1006) TaxID=441959 RepID=B8MCZ1_TALSN|nr:uncharacterized protein TSTA_113430 [Talaromyces stipitatus ATCC 10500]EED17517.1 conserved hypothetical protein [Talaromyces stipitatus ATCC 10500]
MSHASRYRSSSPGGRRLVDPLRASTGTVAEDLYTSPTSYHNYDGYLSPKVAERRGGFFSVDSGERLEAHPISTTTYRDGNHSTKLKTSYAIRPRSQTTDSSRRPLSLSIPSTTSSTRKGPIITSGYQRSTSPLPPRTSHARDEPERYILPASSGRSHRRIYSSDYTSDSGYGKSVVKHRSHEPRYHIYRPAGVSRYHAYGDPRQWDDSKYYDAYSYTNARETFEKESAARSSQRTHHRVGRPTSMVATGSALIRPVHHKESKRLSSSHRGSNRHHEDDRLRITNGRDFTDSETHRDHHRYPHQQRLVVHQDREDGYQSFTDDHKHSSRHRHSSRARESRKKRAEDYLAPVLGGLATLGLASGYSDDGRDTDRSGRSIRHRSRDPGHDDHDRDYYQDRERGKEGVSGDEHARRRHRRHRDRSKRPSSSSDSDDSDSEAYSRRRRREKSSSRKKHDSSSSEGGRDRRKEESGKSLPVRKGDGESVERPRKPVAVEPPATKEPEAPPKSILKPPREKFPEDETHMREGVAPLKDAQKNGIPPGARWTKIDRRLVNPAALEMGHERFEERPEYVIVLRVLTKEEIQAYAVKTQEIRDARQKATQEERRRLREERRRNGQVDTSSSDDEDDDEDESAPLAIEPAPMKDDFPVPRGRDRVANEVPVEVKK